MKSSLKIVLLKLCQRHELGDEFNDIYQSINSRIHETLLQDIDKVNTQTAAPALSKLKSSKSDPVFDFNSDCLFNSPPELIQHVTNLFKWFLRTGKVPAFLLLCTIVPIAKDNIGDITSSHNYETIAIVPIVKDNIGDKTSSYNYRTIAIVPIVKDNIEDITSSDNYRTIAIVPIV